MPAKATPTTSEVLERKNKYHAGRKLKEARREELTVLRDARAKSTDRTERTQLKERMNEVKEKYKNLRDEL